MTEPLSVDPSRLGAIGQKLASLVFPALPSPITANGSDPVSSAINATMPNLESLVTDGMPGVKAALTRTASNMAAAADVYTKADQSLGDTLRQAQFGSGLQALTGGASGVAGQFSGLMSGPLEKVAPQLSEPLSQAGAQLSAKAAELSPRVEATVPQLVALAPAGAQLAQQGAPMMLSTVTQFAGQAGSGGSQAAAPATLAGDTTKDGDDADPDTEEGPKHEGAGAGVHTVGNVPTHGGTGGPGPAGTTSTI